MSCVGNGRQSSRSLQTRLKTRLMLQTIILKNNTCLGLGFSPSVFGCAGWEERDPTTALILGCNFKEQVGKEGRIVQQWVLAGVTWSNGPWLLTCRGKGHETGRELPESRSERKESAESGGIKDELRESKEWESEREKFWSKSRMLLNSLMYLYFLGPH